VSLKLSDNIEMKSILLKFNELNKEDFLKRLADKVNIVIKDWPQWKHEVLENSFKSKNKLPRRPIV
jgi:hypothetical protein